jgi:hypothetical protein
MAIDEVTEDSLTDIIRFYNDAYRKAKDDGVPLPPRLDPDLVWNGTTHVPPAQLVGRFASTVSREIARHGGRPAYGAGDADRQAWIPALRPKVFACREPQVGGHSCVCQSLALSERPTVLNGKVPLKRGCVAFRLVVADVPVSPSSRRSRQDRTRSYSRRICRSPCR